MRSPFPVCPHVPLPGLPKHPPTARSHRKSLSKLWPPPHSPLGLLSALLPPRGLYLVIPDGDKRPGAQQVPSSPSPLRFSC